MFTEQNEQPRVAFSREASRKILQKINFTNPPVSLTAVINELSNYDLISVKGIDLDLVDGINLRSMDEINIYYNKNNHPNRTRFTIAHELGHFVLGHMRRDFDFNLQSKDIEEREANEFASELLIPTQTLKKLYRQSPNAKVLADMFRVSEEALYYKLLSCRLLSAQPKSNSLWG